MIDEIQKPTIETDARRPARRALRRYAEDAKELLQQRFREPLRLEDVASALYVSTYHLCRVFKEETGMSIHRYLNQLRLRQALKELAHGDTALATLANDLGFCCQSHFTRAFRKEFGAPPGEVRRRVQDRLRQRG
ncbi:MAG: AraC family transcriptional regulator [Acidobacteriota bacterium]|jgi:AraC-like DNA-binding protein|nr:AraC family transcriptional regulator [Acidobacteriota bacterium]